MEKIRELASQQRALWQQDRQLWQTSRPVTAALAELLDIVPAEVNQVATATTDGRRLLFNPTWSAGLPPAQRRHLQEHLVWHAAVGDYRSHPDKNAHRWHLACDHSINVQLIQLGAKLSHDTALFPLASTWSREQVYSWLAGHPRLEFEQSPDQLIWDMPFFITSDDALTEVWHQHIQTTVERYQATSALPESVAQWLLGCR